ncbi:hypothetical protein Tco_0556687 [Tanacetum coccineum]
MEEFTTNDKANYYFGIASIMVNGKRTYELKGKFLFDLRDNAFSGTNGEDAMEHIEYFLKIIDPINLSNVNYERLRLFAFPISLVENASEWFDEFKGSITSWVDLTGIVFGKYYPPSRTDRFIVTKAIRDPSNSTFEKWLASKFTNHMTMDLFTKKVLWDFWIKSNDHEGVADEGFFDAEEVNPELFTHDIERTKTYEEYENELNDELEEPWSEDGVPYEICDHICESFHFNNGKAKWPTCNSNEDRFYNGGELLGMVWVSYMTYFQDYKWYNELADGNLKEEALKNFYELDYEQLVKLQDYWWKVNDHEYSPFSDWRNHIQGPYANYYSNFLDKEEHEDKDKHGLFDDQK